MFERFSAPARRVVIEAQQQARALQHTEILAEHLLLGVLADETCISASVLDELGVQHERLVAEVAALGLADEDALRAVGIDLAAVRRAAESAFGAGALDRPRRSRRGLRGRLPWLGGQHLRFTDPAKRALEQSLRQAISLQHNHIGTDHILLGLLADDRSPAALTLSRLGVDPAVVRARVRERLQQAA